MRKLIFILASLCLFYELSGAQEQIVSSANITLMYYLSGEYDKCTAMADAVSEVHPSSVDDFCILGYGANAIHRRLEMYDKSVTQDDTRKMTNWALAAVYYLDDWLKNNIPDDKSSASEVIDYLSRLELANSCSSIVNFAANGKAKNEAKLFASWCNNAHKRLYKIRGNWDDSPWAQLFILDNAARYYTIKNRAHLNLPKGFMDEFWSQIDKIAALSDQMHDHTQIVAAGTYVYKLLQLYKAEFSVYKKKENPEFIDFLLKVNDFRLYANGAAAYRDFKNVSWKKIQARLQDGEYCMIHFEAPIKKGMTYLSWDPTSRIRNYVYVFNNKSAAPEYWSRGFRNDIENKDFSAFKDEYPDLEKIYVTGTDAMMLKDITRFYSEAYRLHSLSELTHPKTVSENGRVLYIGDIDYSMVRDSLYDGTKGGVRRSVYYPFLSDKQVKEDIATVYRDSLKVLSGHQATPENILPLLSGSHIIHISAHGEYDEQQLSENNSYFSPETINGVNVLKSCKLLLSGYNDDKTRYISADDIRKLDLSSVDLVFLDACETGNGRLLSGGAYTLAEAFHMAGVRNVIAYLNPVSADIAGKFASRFYYCLNDGVSYHDAFYFSKLVTCPGVRIVLWE